MPPSRKPLPLCAKPHTFSRCGHRCSNNACSRGKTTSYTRHETYMAQAGTPAVPIGHGRPPQHKRSAIYNTKNYIMCMPGLCGRFWKESSSSLDERGPVFSNGLTSGHGGMGMCLTHEPRRLINFGATRLFMDYLVYIRHTVLREDLGAR